MDRNHMRIAPEYNRPVRDEVAHFLSSPSSHYFSDLTEMSDT